MQLQPFAMLMVIYLHSYCIFSVWINELALEGNSPKDCSLKAMSYSVEI